MIGQHRLILEPREVPLGGVRGMNVLRALPHRNLPTIGAWCFLDHYGPDDVAATGSDRPTRRCGWNRIRTSGSRP